MLDAPTLQVRIHHTIREGHGEQTTFWYFQDVGPARAAQLAAEACAARCVTDVDYFSVHDDAYAPADDPPVLVADWLGRPLVTTRRYLAVHEAREALTGGQRLRMKVGDDPEDPTLILYLDDGMVISESVAGWSAGVVEPVCALDSDFLQEHLAGRLLVEVA